MLRSFEISLEKNVCHSHTAAFDEITKKKFGCVHFLGETKISANWRQQSAVRKWCGRIFTRASLFALQVRTSSGGLKMKNNFLFAPVSRIFLSSLLVAAAPHVQKYKIARVSLAAHANYLIVECIFSCGYTMREQNWDTLRSKRGMWKFKYFDLIYCTFYSCSCVMRATNEKLRQNARHVQLESIYNASHCDSLTARLIAEIAEHLLMNYVRPWKLININSIIHCWGQRGAAAMHEATCIRGGILLGW